MSCNGTYPVARCANLYGIEGDCLVDNDTDPIHQTKPEWEEGETGVDEEGLNKREKWTRGIDFLLACIGFSVGLGNVWRFPYLCYRNGGGAFLIPYLICVLIGGIPLFYIEVVVGQFTGSGGIGSWKICPLFEGIGFACTIVVFLLNCYYNVVLCWAFYYLFASFTTVLPWSTCDNPWNTDQCVVRPNITGANASSAGNDIAVTKDPVTEFWEYKVLNISSGIEDVGMIKMDLALCLLVAWVVVFFCICKGIRTSGKVMYFTATCPYILMFILLVRGALLEGSFEGIIFYIIPQWGRLLDMQVWVDAGTQIFFSYSISLGTLTALGSYNKFNHNSFRDSILFALANSGTSILAGFVIFAVLGHMAHLHNIPVSEVAAAGPGLAFIAYPKAISAMPLSPLWSALFFFMVILLGLDSQFVGVEGFVTSIVDMFPKQLRVGHRKEVFIGITCLVKFFIGLSMVTNGGMYVFQLFDYYAGSKIILLIAFFEVVVVSWIYGIDRFYDNIKMMYGFRLDWFFYIMWSVLSPIFCLTIFVMSAINYSELTYDRKEKGMYEYPGYAVGIGWAMASISVFFIPVFMLIRVVKTLVHGKSIRSLVQPEGLEKHQLRPQDMVGAQLIPPMSNLGNENLAYRPNSMSSMM
ncbi:sodium- and chloride-dependent taurine transporter-like [Lineus longissimus]|uniref:sodium- and chloride-dependent taurine transporter-like n=1 Tax=Lineus longissimus TaxID=88925 RepID=UPI002B4CA4CC